MYIYNLYIHGNVSTYIWLLHHKIAQPSTSYQEEKIASSLLLGGMIGPVVATYLPGSLAPSPAAVRTKDGTGPALVGSTSHRRGVTGVLKRGKLGPLGGF